MGTDRVSFYDLAPDARAELLCELARSGLGHWGLEDAELTLVKYRENVVFKAERAHGPPLAVRVHRHGYHSDAALRSELEWIRALGADGVDVPEVVPTRGGDLFVRARVGGVPESRQVDVFEWIDGEHMGEVGERLADDPTALGALYAQVGEIAARIHAHGVSWRRPPGFERPRWDADGLTGEHPVWGRFWELEALSAEERALIERTRDVVRGELLAYGKPNARYGLIHADLVLENLLVDGDRVRLIDFDDAGEGWHLFELATVMRLYLDTGHLELVRDALVEGYRRHRDLGDEQVGQLPLFLMARALTYLAWMHTRRDTESARIKTPAMIAMACGLAERFLSGDRVG